MYAQNHIVFGDSRMLQEIRNSETLPEGYFHNLTSMVVEDCEFLSDAILPSHLLHLLSNLKKLQVRRCNSLKAVFSHTKITDMGPQGSLTHLEELHVENCEELVAIVEKGEAETDEANKEIAIFSSITLLRLSNLPNLRCIYPGTHILKWGKLKELHVKHCQKLKFFATEYQNSTGLNQYDQDRFSTDQQEVVSLEKVWHFGQNMTKHTAFCAYTYIYHWDLFLRLLLGHPTYTLCVNNFVITLLFWIELFIY